MVLAHAGVAGYDRGVAVGIKVGAGVELLGDGDFVTAFFSTIAGNLEPEGWGSRFPVAMGALYDGDVPNGQVRALRRELDAIRAELKQLAPDRVIWDLDDRDARPPWEDNIASDITDLGNYFVTMDGKDMFDVIDDALDYAERSGQGVTLKSLGPVGPRRDAT
jgi:2,3-bisphosphoglycerate-dependent phosphoglycerate mutase